MLSIFNLGMTRRRLSPDGEGRGLTHHPAGDSSGQAWHAYRVPIVWVCGATAPDRGVRGPGAEGPGRREARRPKVSHNGARVARAGAPACSRPESHRVEEDIPVAGGIVVAEHAWASEELSRSLSVAAESHLVSAPPSRMVAEEANGGPAVDTLVRAHPLIARVSTSRLRLKGPPDTPIKRAGWRAGAPCSPIRRSSSYARQSSV
ncbi:MAG: hypothetical protein J2P17_22540 [Mycobacterium sp.]|nr:hypothetical protein [Mycobacterium sp.]